MTIARPYSKLDRKVQGFNNKLKFRLYINILLLLPGIIALLTLLVGCCLGLLDVGLGTSYMLYANQFLHSSTLGIVCFFSILALIPVFLIAIMANMFYKSAMKEIRRVHNTNIHIENIENIMEGLSRINNTFHRFLLLKKLLYIFVTKIGLHEALGRLQHELDELFSILLDLRSDLATRLIEQQQALESAKSEVETNIQGTTELELVSELQKTRLDRQIEQFEELQRVLVKI